MSLEIFLPSVRRWFETRLGEPTAPQRSGWPKIRDGKNVLIAAPTGSGKTLAAFLSAIDRLLGLGRDLADETHVVYVSPLKALSNDVEKNLSSPLAEIRAIDPDLPEVRVMVRTGDTSSRDRSAMTKKPPHVLVTTPESLYILLTSAGGRAMLSTTKTVIVDEIHALAKDKRGSHLSLSLERLRLLAGDFQRIGLSATQKPLEDVARFLVGKDRDCEIVDAGTFRALDLAVVCPSSPLSAVCSLEVWEEIYRRMADLILEHRTTLVFVNTRKAAERIAARLSQILGDDKVTSHHGSLSREHRLFAEARLKSGGLRALVATASLELGIDIGDVDLAIQVGASRSIAVFLQRIGRAGHAVKRTPKGRIFPLTLDELVESAAILSCVKKGILDRTPQPPAPLDILAQQVVATAVAEPVVESELFAAFTRAWPYRDLPRADFDAVVKLHTDGRYALLHRDGVQGRILATKRARLTAITSGGAIPDNADYRVLLEPEGTFVGTLNEDFAIESNSGDIFQLGNTSWRILKIEPGLVRVADAKGQPPSLPFWLGEAPSRTEELSAEIARLRDSSTSEESLIRETGIDSTAASQILAYVEEARRSLGLLPTQERLVLERFFDESGGMQLVLHSPFGGRINRAFGLALRKRFCRGFGFELQAAANEEAIVLSLGPQHSFPLEEVFDYLHPQTAEDLLIQAVLASPMFETRWRWNVGRALLLDRTQKGKRVPAPIMRMRAQDLLVGAFPQAAACPETLPGGDIEVPSDHPIVRQTIDDCLHEAMDVDGFLSVLRGLRSGAIGRHAVDTTEPSAFAAGILTAQPYAFLDDAPLEERRTQAVMRRRTLDQKSADDLGALDPEAIRRVKEEAWPRPENAEEVHEALSWMGYVTVEESRDWREWLDELFAARRIERIGDKIFAVESTRDEKAVLRGRLEALGPVFFEDPLLFELERDGVILRARFEGRQGFCDRRLLARIHRQTIEKLRKEIEPITAAQFQAFLAMWQHVAAGSRLFGPAGVVEIVGQLAGFEAHAAAWESTIFPARIDGYRRDLLEEATLGGEVAFCRLWGGSSATIKVTPISFFPRADIDLWTGLAGAADLSSVGGPAAQALDALAAKGPMFTQDIARVGRLLPDHLDTALGELLARGALTCDSYSAVRRLLIPAAKRHGRIERAVAGRWSLIRTEAGSPPPIEFVARALLARTGIVFRKTFERERVPVTWRELVLTYRRLEAKGEIRGGRFVAGFSGEQFALPEAVTAARKLRRDDSPPVIDFSDGDPADYRTLLFPDGALSGGRNGPRARRETRVV